MNHATDLASRFAAGRVEADGFDHRAHLEVAHTLLARHDFLTAVDRFTRGARALAASAGASEAFNLTLTVAWMSLLAERLEARPGAGIDDLLTACPELRDTQLVGTLYGNERLSSPLAKRTFLLPRPAPGAAG